MIKETVSSLITICFSMVASGQNIDLENVIAGATQTETIYIGIQNKFRIVGFKYLRKIEPVTPVISIHEDTIILSPNQVGPFHVTFRTTHGNKEVLFNSEVISDPLNAIGDLTGKVVRREDAVLQGGIRIHSFNSNETFFDKYKISVFTAALNDQVFSIRGELFSDELRAAIKNAKSGDKLVFSSVKATNEKDNSTISLATTEYELK